jgi:hypothetical protein
MTRIIGPTGSRRRRRFLTLAPLVAIVALVFSISASAGPVSDAAGFEGDDANLVANSTLDWNSFATVTWPTTGAPYRTASKTTSGWKFTGIEDAAKPPDSADTVFVGGVKQDDECPGVRNDQNPPNKDDLKRIYIASSTVGGHVYLALAWARVPQNSTSSSAHAAFEFNQNKPSATNSCPAGSDSLVKRSTAHGGDVLIVYDFEGGSAPVVLKLLRWKTTGTCEQTGKSADTTGPCWVKDETFTAWEAKVNTSDATDNIAPNAPDTLHTQEFGEAIVDLTAANVLDPSNPTDCVSFGRAFGVTRSSGNSGVAQMKDLVGPADINITNCATVIIRKVTSPSGDTVTNFSYSTNVHTLPGPNTVADFTLKDGGSKTITDVKAESSRTVTEADPSPVYLLTSIDCSASTVPAANRSTNTTTRAVTFSIAAGETLDCTFTNTKQKQESSMGTSPWIYPNDTATVTPTDATGTVTFKLYDNSTNCAANGATGLLYSETVTLPASAPKTVSTSNPGTTGSPNSKKVESTAKVYWRVQYSGNSAYFGRLSNCVENIDVTLTGHTGGTNVPDP